MHHLLRMLLVAIGLIAVVAIAPRFRPLSGPGLKDAPLDDLREIVKKEPGNWRARFYLAYQLGTTHERHEEAYDLLRPLVSEQPDSEDVQYAFAQAALKTRRVDESIQALQRVIKINPGNEAVYGQLGSLFSQLGLYPEATEQLEKIIAIHPEQPHMWTLLGKALLEMGDIEAAESRFNELATRMGATMGGGHTGLARIALSRGQYEVAEQHLRTALGAYRSDPDAYLVLAKLYQVPSWKNTAQEQIAKDMMAAIQSFPENADAHYLLGKFHFESRRMPDAMKELKAATSQRNVPANAWRLLAELYRLQGKESDRRDSVRKYETILTRQREESRLSKLVRDTPHDADRRFALARFYVAHGDLKHAWGHFSIGLREKKDPVAAREAQKVRGRLIAGEGADPHPVS